MRTSNWRELERIFNAAVILPKDLQPHFVALECGADKELCQKILLMLEKDSEENSFLNNPVLTLGMKLLDENFKDFLEKGDFSHYKLQQLIGRGGMGAVFLAEDTRLGRPTAIKLLSPVLTGNQENIMRFQQEARAASVVSHQNVAHIYEFGQHEGLYYLAMEYVLGRTLRELIKEKLIDEHLAVKYAIQIASALSAAHKCGIVHRDIKPENIIITEEGLVKILDFGIAKLTDDPLQIKRKSLADNSFETIPGLIMGTTPYMSPEQIRGQSIDQRTDLWSLGIVLYEILTGTRPFTGATQSDIQAEILKCKAPILPRNLLESRKLNSIVVKLLEKDRLKRYQTSADVIHDLEKLRDSLRTKKRQANLLKQWLPGKRAMPGGALILSLLVIISSGVFWDKTFESNSSPANSATVNTRSSLPENKIKILEVQAFNFGGSVKNAQLIKPFSLELAEELRQRLGSANLCRVKTSNNPYSNFILYNSPTNSLKNIPDGSAILRGNITNIDGVSLRVDLELLDAGNGIVVWQDSIEAQNSNLLKLVFQVLKRIDDNLKPFLTSGKKLFSDFPQFISQQQEEAFRLFLIGKYSDQNPKEQIKLLEQSVEFSRNSKTYLALANKYYRLSKTSNSEVINNWENVKTFLGLALYLNPNSSDAHMFSARIKMEERDWTGVEKELRLAIKLNPNNHIARLYYGSIFLPARGKFKEALEEITLAYEIAPYDNNIQLARTRIKILAKDYASITMYERAYEEDIKLLYESKSDPPSLYPNMILYLYRMLAILMREPAGKVIEIDKKVLEFFSKMSNESIESKIIIGIIYAKIGNTEKAQEIIKELKQSALKEGSEIISPNLEIKTAGNEKITPYDIALIYAAIGDKNRAFEYLEKEIKARNQKSLFVEVDPLLDSLRPDSRFDKIKNKIKLPADF